MTLYQKLQQFKKKEFQTNMDMGTALQGYIARDSVQTYDYGIQYQGLGDALTKITNRTDWQEVLANAGYALSVKGDNVALILDLINGEPFIDYAEVAEIVKVGNVITEAKVNAQRSITIDNKEYTVYFSYSMNKEGKVEKVESYFKDTVWVYIYETKITTPFKVIPVYPLKNNVLGMADIPDELLVMVSQLDWLSDEFIPEWIAASTQWINNKSFGSTESADDILEKKMAHEKMLDADDPDNKIGPSTAPLSMGSQSPAMLSTLINYLEDKILKYSMQFREVGGGGTNKHNLEIASENKQAFEYMLAKLDWRQRQLSEAFTLFQSLIASITEGENENEVTVTIEIPELEAFKKDNMQAQVDNVKAQAENQLGQAKSWEASAEATENGVQTTQPGGE